MRGRAPTLLVCATALAACGPGSTAPPALAYRLPDPTDVRYVVGDTLSVSIDALGQSLSLGLGSSAIYGAAFERAEDGVSVTLTLESLRAEVLLPIGGPLRVDEQIVDGDLVLSLDRRGDVTILDSPDVPEAARPFFAGPAVAHSIFPGLPGRAVAMGDRWVDTVAYSDDLSGGEASQRSITEYTVVGDAVVEGRSLVEITFKGTSDSRQTMALQGAEVRQETLTEIEGHVLWDVERGLLFEREMRSVGTGTVRVALAPGPLPTRVESRSRVRLQTQ